MNYKYNTIEGLVDVMCYIFSDMRYDINIVEINGKFRESFRLYGYLCLNDIELYQLTNSIVEINVDNVIHHVRNSELIEKEGWLIGLLNDTLKFVSDDEYEYRLEL